MPSLAIVGPQVAKIMPTGNSNLLHSCRKFSVMNSLTNYDSFLDFLLSYYLFSWRINSKVHTVWKVHPAADFFAVGG